MNLLAPHADLIFAVMAAISVSSALLVASWPYLARDTLGDRMRQVADEREALRLRERSRMQSAGSQVSLRIKPRQLFKDIVDRLKLGNPAQDGEMSKLLCMAGYRGQGPVVTFLVSRLVTPPALMAIAALYVFVVLRLQQPLTIKMTIVIAAGLLGYYVPALYIRNRVSKRQQAIRRGWPDALDLLLICVESGMGVESAFRKVSEEIGQQSPQLAEELSLTTAELSYLPDRRRAYDNLAQRTGLEGVKSVVTSLIQAEKYGTPVGQSLRVLAQENRDMRMSEAEKKAAALPPKLTVPMILFFLPVLFAVIITPAAIQISRTY